MTNKTVRVISSTQVTKADLVCTHCGIDHFDNSLSSKEGIDYVFETDGEDEWCICISCKNECDNL